MQRNDDRLESPLMQNETKQASAEAEVHAPISRTKAKKKAYWKQRRERRKKQKEHILMHGTTMRPVPQKYVPRKAVPMQGTNMEAHQEIERKYLIAYPDLTVLRAQEGVRFSSIRQTYLKAPRGITHRVRARTTDGVTVYTETTKRRLTSCSAWEEEREITAAQYANLLLQADPRLRTVEKTRYCIPYKGHLLEIDVYPFWSEKAILEVELETEEERVILPPYLCVLSDVTQQTQYKNRALAEKLPKD